MTERHISRRQTNPLSQGIAYLLHALIVFYQIAISPILHLLAPGGGCRFYPTCSEYAKQAVQEHGPLKGSFLALRRLARCHPLGGHGYDPVPLKQCCCQSQEHHAISNKQPDKQF